MTSLFYDSSLWFRCAKVLVKPEEDCQVLVFVNPVWDSEYEDDKILEPGNCFSGTFNTLLN